MAEPTLYEHLGGIAIAAVVDNVSDRLTRRCPTRSWPSPARSVPGRYIRVRYLTVSGWWPR